MSTQMDAFLVGINSFFFLSKYVFLSNKHNFETKFNMFNTTQSRIPKDYASGNIEVG